MENNEMVGTAVMAGFAIAYLVFCVLAYVFMAVCQMKIAQKLNTPNAWLAWIPIGNVYLMTVMAGRPGWWTILLFIPLINIVIGIMLWVDILKKLGKPAIAVLLVIFFGIFYLPYLAFSKK